MKRICKASGTEFEITDEDLAFYKKVSPKIGGKIYEIPPPTLCPEERQRRRLVWRNLYHLTYRKCDATGKNIITNYGKDTGYKVYDNPYWWSDNWDARDYGRDFDFSRSFFDQFQELMMAVPHPNVTVNYPTLENSEFTNYAAYIKDCYLVFHADMNEGCLYNTNIKKSKDCVDNLFIFDSELLHECIDCQKCYRLFFSQNCENCSNSWFLKDCIGCKDCFGCTNLRHQQYVIFNRSVTKDGYDTFLKNFLSNKHSELTSMQAECTSFWQQQFFQNLQQAKNENCVGDQIYECENVKDSFDIKQARDMKHCQRISIGENHDCYDIDQYGMSVQMSYEGSGIGDRSAQILFGILVNSQANNVLYSMEVFLSRDCFGCVGLRDAKYCILNKQYSKEKYEELVPKIIEHMKKTPLNPPLTGGKQAAEWGEFFPIELSPFAYNETVAQEYFPMTKEEVLAKGWKWRDETNEIPNVSKVIPANRLPDSIDDIPDDILNWAIQCEETKKPFKIQKAELEFYRKMRLPIPHYHPDVRHGHRMKKRNPRKLWERNCGNCGISIQTTYAPERPEKVFCERCYQESVY